MKKLLSTVVTACAMVSMHAGATTIGFEGVVGSSSSVVPVTPYTESGFTFTDLQRNGTDGIFGSAASNSNGTATFVFCSYNTGCGTNVFITLTANDAAPFSLSSIAAANWQGEAATGSIDLVGHLVGGGTVTASVAAGAAWGTYAIAGFNNLSSVDFYGRTVYAVAMDNLEINAAAVPEPASLALLGLGLAGVAGIRRRKNG